MTAVTPESFDVDAWLTDAHLPEESATVYKRPDVISELTDLKRRIELERDDSPTAERTAAEAPATAALEAEYERLLTVFSESALTVYVRALARDEMNALRKAHEDAVEAEEMTSKESNEQFGYDLLAKAIIGVKSHGQDRQPATFTPAKVKAFETAIGSSQLPAILAARQKAQNSVPVVDADFLRRPSGTEPGQE